MGVGRVVCRGFGQIPRGPACLTLGTSRIAYAAQQRMVTPTFNRGQSRGNPSLGWSREASTDATHGSQVASTSGRIYRSTSSSRPLPHPTSIFHYHFPSSAAVKEEPCVYTEFPDHLPAYIDGITGEQLSREDVRRSALRLGYALTHSRRKGDQALAQTGDVVLILSPNSLHYPIVFFACQSALLIPTPCNSGATSRDVAYQIKDSGAKIGFVHPDLIGVWEGALEILRNEGTTVAKEAEEMPMHLMASIEDVAAFANGSDVSRKYYSYQSLVQPEDTPTDAKDVDPRHWTESMAAWQGVQVEEASFNSIQGGSGVSYDDTAVICYSSGTTGLPKGKGF